MKIISCSIELASVFATNSPAHSDIADNEEADRMANVRTKQAKTLQKEKRINKAIAKSKAKSLSMQTLATRWERQVGTKYQYLVP